MKHTKLVTGLMVAALPGAAAFGDISLTENLAVRGFIDSSYVYDDRGATTDESLEVDAFDIDFLLNQDKITSEIHLSSVGGLDIEQAFVTYNFDNGLSITGGQFLTLHGYERDEPYTILADSRAYDVGGDMKQPYALYHSGLRASYSSENFTGTISIVDSIYTNDGDADDLGFEAQIQFTGIDNFVFALGTAQDDQDAAAGVDKYWNFWVEYNGIEKLLLAAEYNTYEFAGEDAKSWLLLGSYDLTDKASVAVRYSDVDEDNAAYQADKITIAPSYAITDNLLGRVEYSNGEADGVDVDLFAVQFLWTF